MANSINEEYKPKPRERVLQIIELLLKNRMSAKEIEYAIFGTDNANKRTIQSDLDFLIHYFGDDSLIKVKKGKIYYYKIVNMPKIMNDFFTRSPDEIRDIYEFVTLFDANMLKVFEKEEPLLVSSIKKEVESLYTVVNAPLEHIEANEIWRKVKIAIRRKRYVNIEYKKNKHISYKRAKPIKILMANNNWYLALIVEQNSDIKYSFTPLRIAHIVSVDIEKESYYSKSGDVQRALKHIKNMQSLFDAFEKPRKRIKLLADANIAIYFKQKKYLKSQNIIEIKDNGSLVISYDTNSDDEIFTIVKKWLPNLHIIEPIELKERFNKILQSYIKL